MITRRGILGSLLAAPVIIRSPGLLMPIRRVPDVQPFVFSGFQTIIPIELIGEEMVRTILRFSFSVPGDPGSWGAL